MKILLMVSVILVLGSGCGSSAPDNPEPHLELGQRISFVGGEAEKTYVVVGYRHLLEDKTDKKWNSHDYIVFSYSTDQGAIKVATIHRNAILKK